MLEVYDPALNRFLDAGLLPAEMRAVRLVRLPDDRILAVSRALTAIIDPDTFALDLLTPANGLLLEGFVDAEPAWPRMLTLLADGTVLLAGGCCDSEGRVLDDAAIFDPERRALASVGPLAVARAGAQTALLCDGRVLIAGGIAGLLRAFQATDTAERYDPASQTFSAIEPMGAPRQRHTLTVLPDGDVLVFGHSRVNPDLPIAELFRTGCS